MEKLRFKIHGLGQRYVQDENADFILHENGWDDYNFRTVYTVVATSKLLELEYGYEIGTISIIKIGQETGMNVLSRRLEQENGMITELPNDFVSISRDSNLTNILFCILTPKQRKDFIQSMHMILGHDNYYERIHFDNCFHASALRGISKEELMETLGQSYNLMHSELDGKKIIKSFSNRIKE